MELYENQNSVKLKHGFLEIPCFQIRNFQNSDFLLNNVSLINFILVIVYKKKYAVKQ